jgi:UDP-2,3-diacylglucosamine pyrophosphatase LpxH
MALKLFLSDLHIGDGSSNDDFVYDRELIRLFNQLKDVDENYEIVLIGDGLEILESDAVRKIGLVNFSQICESIRKDVLTLIIDRHRVLFEFIRDLARTHKIHYVVGNHDYYFIVNDELKNFMLDFMNSKNFEITSHFYDEENGIFAQHGSQHDLMYAFTKTKDDHLIPPLGDYVTRYTMGSFEPMLRSANLPIDVARDYDNIRPTMDAIDWLEYINAIYKVPIDLVGEWIRSFLKAFKTNEFEGWIHSRFPRTYWMGEIVFRSPTFFQIGRRLTTLVDDFQKFRNTNYLKSKAEKLLNAYHVPEWKLSMKDVVGYSDRVPDIDYSKLKVVLFGHNHLPGFYVIPTPAGPRYYVNTGTWRPLVEKTRGKWGQIIFHKKIELNYALINTDGNDSVIETHLVSRVVLN